MESCLDIQRGIAVMAVLFLVPVLMLKNTLCESELQSYLHWNKRHTLGGIAPFQSSSWDV